MIRLLLVDDGPDILEVAELALTITGDFEVAVCASGTEALERAAALREVPGLGHVPAIFLTASQHEGKEAELLAAGAIAVLQKPFDPLTLGDQIKAVLAS